MFRWQNLTILFIISLTISFTQPARALALFEKHPYCEGIPQPAQPLQYNPRRNKWWFSGTVIEVQQIHAIGMPAQVAHIQSAGFKAWVFQSFETDIPYWPYLILGHARVGDPVMVSISGPHVLENQINWDLCEPLFSLYCSKGWLYDAGPYAPGIGAMISPSNEFIHFGRPNPSWEQGLYWNTEKLKIDDRSDQHSRRICPA
jgi:hypothetical protein